MLLYASRDAIISTLSRFSVVCTARVMKSNSCFESVNIIRLTGDPNITYRSCFFSKSMIKPRQKMRILPLPWSIVLFSLISWCNTRTNGMYLYLLRAKSSTLVANYYYRSMKRIHLIIRGYQKLLISSSWYFRIISTESLALLINLFTARTCLKLKRPSFTWRISWTAQHKSGLECHTCDTFSLDERYLLNSDLIWILDRFIVHSDWLIWCQDIPCACLRTIATAKIRHYSISMVWIRNVRS